MVGSTGAVPGGALSVGLGIGPGAGSWGAHPLTPMADPKLSMTSSAALTARLLLSPERMGVNVVASENSRRSYPHLANHLQPLASIDA